MIARIEAGEADGIIAWHPDRLSRNAVDAGLLIDLLDRGKLRDLKFHSHRFENTPEGKTEVQRLSCGHLQGALHHKSVREGG